MLFVGLLYIILAQNRILFKQVAEKDVKKCCCCGIASLHMYKMQGRSAFSCKNSYFWNNCSDFCIILVHKISKMH